MKKFQGLGRSLSAIEMKGIKGGYDEQLEPIEGSCGTGNTYCGTGTGVTCCVGYSCVDAGNGSGSGAGQDKLCSK